jgi:type I restriction enzyme, S subunit
MSEIIKTDEASADFKNSDIDWLGDIPAHWEVVPLKWRCQVQSGQVDPKEPEYAEMMLVAPDHIESGTGRLHEVTIAEEQGAISGKYLCPEGSILYSKIRPALRKVALYHGQCLCSADMYSIVPGNGLTREYLFYFFLSDVFSSYAELDSLRVAMPKVNREALGAFPLPVPSLDEQTKIARFLDEKTARIDGLIEKKRALLDRLAEKRQALITRAVTKGLDPDAPMKPSGIDWLGDIPAHWEPIPLKRLGQVRSGITKGKSYSNEETVVLPYLRVANVQDGWLELNEIAEIEVRANDVQKYALENGDILMNEGGDNDKLGRGTVWRCQISPCLHQNHVFAVRLNTLDPEWIARCTEAAYTKFHFFRRAVQSTNLASISRTVVADLPIPLPPRDEIARILAALGLELGQMSEQMDKIDRTITLLAEYRSALITAVVTGQLAELR